MGAFAEAIVEYARPLIDATDGSLQQMNKALSMSQACWNLAVTPAEQRLAAIDEMQGLLEMSAADFAYFQRNILLPMLRRHEEMFPKLHQQSGILSPHWDAATHTSPPPSSLKKTSLPRVTPPPQPLDLDEAIGVLDAAFNAFPEAALRACQANQDAAIPRLIGVLESKIRRGQSGTSPEGNAAIYALFLLAEFKATAAIDAIWRFLKLPRDIPEQLLGDAITEDLPRILAIFAGNRLDLLDDLLLDPEHNRWVKSAAIGACRYAVRDQSLSRRDAVNWLKSHLTEATRRRDVSITDSLICNLLQLNANEARAEMEQAIRDGLVDEWIVSLKSVNNDLRPDAPEECNCPPHHSPTEIADTVEELRGWIWQDESSADFKGDDLPQDDQPLLRDKPFHFPTEDGDFVTPPPLTIRRDDSRIGRNDPCPCGSGKKFKKCCLRSALA